MTINDDVTDSEFLDPSLAERKNLAFLVYILQGFGFVTGGLTWIAAMMVNYIKFDSIRDTWLETHFRWQLNTFWYGLLWWVAGSNILVVTAGLVSLGDSYTVGHLPSGQRCAAAQ